MELWYNPTTLELKAIYSHSYTGSVWQNAGYVSIEVDGIQLPRAFAPGAILSITNGVVTIAVPAPPPPPNLKLQRRGELLSRLETDVITTAEIKELLRLEHGY